MDYWLSMKDIREDYLTAPDGRIWYKIANEHAPGIPLLCLHGGPGFPHDYLEILEDLGEERPVIFYDQMGCGRSERPRDEVHWTVNQFTEELELVRTALDLKKFHLLGQSWGTMLAAEYWLRYQPSGLVSLILSSPVMSAPRFGKDQRRYLSIMPEENQRIIYDAEKSGNYQNQEFEDAMMLYYTTHVCRLDPWPESLNRSMEGLDKEVYNYMWGPSEFTITGTLKEFDVTGRLEEIAVPVLYTCGEFDECTPETTGYFQTLTPGSRYVVFPDASHSHHLEKTDEYLLEIRNFLNEVEER